MLAVSWKHADLVPEAKINLVVSHLQQFEEALEYGQVRGVAPGPGFKLFKT